MVQLYAKVALLTRDVFFFNRRPLQDRPRRSAAGAGRRQPSPGPAHSHGGEEVWALCSHGPPRYPIGGCGCISMAESAKAERPLCRRNLAVARASRPWQSWARCPCHDNETQNGACSASTVGPRSSERLALGWKKNCLATISQTHPCGLTLACNMILWRRVLTLANNLLPIPFRLHQTSGGTRPWKRKGISAGEIFSERLL